MIDYHAATAALDDRRAARRGAGVNLRAFLLLGILFLFDDGDAGGPLIDRCDVARPRPRIDNRIARAFADDSAARSSADVRPDVYATRSGVRARGGLILGGRRLGSTLRLGQSAEGKSG